MPRIRPQPRNWSPPLDELLARPLERIGGPERRMVADADDIGAFWRSVDGTIDIYDDARRLLVVGESEALYIVFTGNLGA
ncbi:hypothetical protein [Streptomyces sp. NBC_01481]|uniref:hypothetical protein n=1 Tax=Streptomyces sp. NBC_01481 TaxID=2975869 RepID=UPI00224DBD21|nr:hypothetical protein [Streptomyces sp. NBC_01481]MCX4586295.1 hypothetical protein [Streptomyces sp. NBC_01481]